LNTYLIRTRRPLWRRLFARARAAYLRFLLKHAEKTLKGHQDDLAQAMRFYPAQVDLDRAYIDSLAKRLMRLVQEF
jgi:hypothetical protein